MLDLYLCVTGWFMPDYDSLITNRGIIIYRKHNELAYDHFANKDIQKIHFSNNPVRLDLGLFSDPSIPDGSKVFFMFSTYVHEV